MNHHLQHPKTQLLEDFSLESHKFCGPSDWLDDETLRKGLEADLKKVRSVPPFLITAQILN